MRPEIEEPLLKCMRKASRARQGGRNVTPFGREKREDKVAKMESDGVAKIPRR